MAKKKTNNRGRRRLSKAERQRRADEQAERLERARAFAGDNHLGKVTRGTGDGSLYVTDPVAPYLAAFAESEVNRDRRKREEDQQ